MHFLYIFFEELFKTLLSVFRENFKKLYFKSSYYFINLNSIPNIVKYVPFTQRWVNRGGNLYGLMA